MRAELSSKHLPFEMGGAAKKQSADPPDLFFCPRSQGSGTFVEVSAQGVQEIGSGLALVPELAGTGSCEERSESGGGS